MRLKGVWMVSVDKEHAFSGQQLLKLGIRLCCFSVEGRVLCARVVCYAARHEERNSSIMDSFSSNDTIELILGFSIT